jgi:hypothetical protein
MIDPISGSADLRMPLVIGAIGHRDLVDDEVELLETRVREFLVTLRQRYPELRVTLMTSLTDGADRLVAGVAKITRVARDLCVADTDGAVRT